VAKTPLDVRKRTRSYISSAFLDIAFCLRFVTLFWPKKVRAGKLEEIHAKMVIKEGAEATALKKPRLSSNGKPPTGNGNGATASSSVRANGKSYR
jgi:chromodomain-helicase-DNA-binding protein 1